MTRLLKRAATVYEIDADCTGRGHRTTEHESTSCNPAEATQYADRVLDHDGDVFRKFDGDLRSLKQAAGSDGALCQYKWSDGKITETGFLVLRQGDIVKRDPWLTEPNRWRA